MPFLQTQGSTLLDSILRGSAEPICSIDEQLRFVATNAAHQKEFLDVFGTEPSVGDAIEDLLAHLPEEQQRSRVLWRRAISGEEFTVVSEFGDPERARRVYEITYRKLTDADGRQIGAIQFGRDLSAQHAAEKARRQSEERFRHLADAMPQLVWTAEADGTVDYYNKRAEEYSGIARGSSPGWEWSPTLHPDDRQKTVDAWREAVATGEPYEVEHRVQLADGTYRWHLSRGVPTLDADGKVMRWYGTATDIEDNKRAELEFREADRRKDEFLAMLGHELRNPLAAIANGIRVLERGGEAGEHALPMVQRHVSQMSRLLDDLLDISRITRDKLHVEREVRPLRPMIAAAAASVRPRVDEFDHHLEVRPVPVVAVSADPTRLEQIITNLLDNAVSYTPPGGHISLWVEADEETIEIHVRDDGQGISAAVVDEIFEPFRQGDASQRRGLGIGLALVRRLVELHDGCIRAHSEGLGEGSEFVVELPRASLDDVDTTSHRADSEARRLDGLEILAIDDNVDAARLMGVLLEDLGCEVTVAETGRVGIEHARSHTFDVVLLDIGLPDICGRQVARELREMPDYEEVRLIAVSGYNQAHDVAASVEAGFDAHLGKPVSPELLHAAITSVEAGQRGLIHADLSRAERSQRPDGSNASAAADAPRGAKAGVDEALVDLIRQLAHDLRGPLSSVEFSAALLDKVADGDTLAGVAARLSRASAAMVEVLDHGVERAGELGSTDDEARPT